MTPVSDDIVPKAKCRTAALGAMVVVLTLIGIARADSIQLRASTTLETQTVELRQIAELTGRSAQTLGDTVVARFDNDDRKLRVRLHDVRRALNQKEVNWGLLTLRGFQRCQVRRAKPESERQSQTTEASTESRSNERPAAASNIRQRVTADAEPRLRGRVESVIQKLAGVERSALRIRFDDHDKKRLALSTWDGRFEIHPSTRDAIGRLPLRVRRYEAGRPVESFTVTADVTRRAEALVVKKHLTRGDRFTEAAVAKRTIWLDDDVTPLADPGAVIGQQAAGTLDTGTVIYPDDVRAPTLIKRGELVTVRCITGGLVVRTVGRATEKGAMDDTVAIRNEGSNETFRATVTGRREAVVNLDAGREKTGPLAQSSTRGDS